MFCAIQLASRETQSVVCLSKWRNFNSHGRNDWELSFAVDAGADWWNMELCDVVLLRKTLQDPAFNLDDTDYQAAAHVEIWVGVQPKHCWYAMTNSHWRAMTNQHDRDTIPTCINYVFFCCDCWQGI